MKNKITLRVIKLGAAAYSVLAVSVLAISLSAQQPAPEPAKAQGDFIRGASLWANTCARCHNMRDPQELNDKKWEISLTHMRLRAGLTGQDSRDILAFLQQSNNKD